MHGKASDAIYWVPFGILEPVKSHYNESSLIEKVQANTIHFFVIREQNQKHP